MYTNNVREEANPNNWSFGINVRMFMRPCLIAISNRLIVMMSYIGCMYTNVVFGVDVDDIITPMMAKVVIG